MARATRGTFAATGTSATVYGTGVFFRGTWAGTATVKLQHYDTIAAAWVDYASYTATQAAVVIADPVRRQWRLNCTAYTNDVTYVLEVGKDR